MYRTSYDTMDESNMTDLRNKGMLLTPTLELTGSTIPNGYKCVRCNTDHIMCMIWDPIGVWEATSNNVLKLKSSQCRLTVFKSDGTKMLFSFKENDYRYSIDNWVVMVCQNKVEFEK